MPQELHTRRLDAQTVLNDWIHRMMLNSHFEKRMKKQNKTNQDGTEPQIDAWDERQTE